jgi:hypothetical protein
MTFKQIAEFKEKILHPSAHRGIVRQILSRTGSVPVAVIDEAVPPDFDVMTGRPIPFPKPLYPDLLDPYLSELPMEKLGQAIVSTHVAMTM